MAARVCGAGHGVRHKRVRHGDGAYPDFDGLLSLKGAKDMSEVVAIIKKCVDEDRSEFDSFVKSLEDRADDLSDISKVEIELPDGGNEPSDEYDDEPEDWFMIIETTTLTFDAAKGKVKIRDTHEWLDEDSI